MHVNCITCDQVVNKDTFQARYPNQTVGGSSTNPYPSFGPNGGLSFPRGTSAAAAGGGGQFPNSQPANNASGFPSNAQYPTLPQQTSQFPTNNANTNNSNGQFQGNVGTSQYPRSAGGYPGGQFPGGAGQVQGVLLSKKVTNLPCNHHINTVMQYPRGPVPYPASEGGQGPSSKYLDEVRFPPEVFAL